MCGADKRRKSLFLVIMTLIIVCGGLTMGERAEAAEVTATDVVRVGVFELNGFYAKGEDGMPTGYGRDYMDKIARRAGLEVEYVWAENWDECVRYLRGGRVDMIAPAQRTPERLEEFSFTSFRMGTECGTLLALSTNQSLIYEDFETFSNISIGCVETLVFREPFMEYASQNGFRPKLTYYRDTKALMAALNAGEIDAALANIFVKTDTTKILAKFSAKPFYYMCRQEDGMLLNLVDEAMQSLALDTPSFETDLMAAYYPDFGNTPFTKAELDYIAQAPVLRVACRGEIQPVSYVDENGEVQGITRDILEEISRISGLRFEYVALPRGMISYDYFRENDISLLSSVEYNKVNMAAPGISLTNPYFDSRKVFVCNQEKEFDVDMELTLAVATGSPTLITSLEEEYPNFHLQIYDHISECFEAVRRGEADALLQNQYVVTNYLARPIYSQMRTIPAEGFEDKHSLSPVVMRYEEGVADELLSDPRLISILNKAINQISEEGVNRIIISQTTAHQYRPGIADFAYQNRFTLIAVGVILLLLAVVGFYVAGLQKKNHMLVVENEAKLRHITNNINGGVVVLAMEDVLRISYANEGFLELLQCKKQEYGYVRNREYTTYVHPEDIHIVKELLNQDLRQENQISVKLRIMRKDGSFIMTLFNGTLVENSKGERELYCVIMDITEQQNLMEKISLEQKKYEMLVESSGDTIFNIDCVRKHLTMSSMFQKKFGWELSEAELSQRIIFDVLKLLRVYEEDKALLTELLETALNQADISQGQVRICTRDGGCLWCRIALYPTVNSKNKLVDVVGRILDVDDEVRTRIEMEHKSKLDTLTGLLNKEAFFEEARNYLQSSIEKNSALIFLDLDKFKQINDNLGHMAGDKAIKDTAKKLQTIFSNYDLLSRFGGDEFCVLLKEISMETLREKLSWTIEKMKATYSENDVSIDISASIGVACTYGRKVDLDTLTEQADQALYTAKENGRSQYAFYQSGEV